MGYRGAVQDINVKIDLDKLPSVDSAMYDSHANEFDPLCHEETRLELRDHIRSWISDRDGQCMFWLRGMAGTGKSTISRTIAKEYAALGQLGASFFFKRGQGDRGNASRFMTTVARQLIQHIPSIKPDIANAINADPAIASKTLQI